MNKIKSGFYCLALVANLTATQLSFSAEVSIAQDIQDLRSTLPAVAKVLNRPDVNLWQVHGQFSEKKIRKTTLVPGGKALQIGIDKKLENSWDVTARTSIEKGFATDDTVLISLWARTQAAENEAQSAIIPLILLETTDGKYESIVSGAATVSKKWTRIYVYGLAKKDYLASEANIVLHLAAGKQTIELGPVTLVNLGKNVDTNSLPHNVLSYPGRDANAAWRADAARRIDKFRKAELRIKLLDTNQNPLNKAKVHVLQKKHAYKFGTYIGHHFIDDNPDKKIKREKFQELFNFATAPIYWSDWGWQNDVQRKSYLETINYLHQQNIDWRAHTLIYPARQFVPTSLVKLENNRVEMKKATLALIEASLSTLQDYPAPLAMDVSNEPRTGSYLTEKTDDDLLVQTFKLAKTRLPDTTLFINEYGVLTSGGNENYKQQYLAYIKKMRALGAPIEGIGLQGHFAAALTHPAEIYKLLDEVAATGLPIQITEFDIDTDDVKAQADYTRDFLTVVFSHPATTAFIVWDFWEGDHWRPQAAMFKTDWTPKPNYFAWKKAIYEDFWTDETLVSDDTGEVKLRAFLGEYLIEVQQGDSTTTQKVTIPKQGTVVSLVLD